MIDFVSNKFRLQRLQRMSSLNGKLFRDMTEEHQNKVLDAPTRSVVIDAGHNTELRYEIFERLNRGSMALNEQELRNCVVGRSTTCWPSLSSTPTGARSEERQPPSRGSYGVVRATQRYTNRGASQHFQADRFEYLQRVRTTLSAPLQRGPQDAQGSLGHQVLRRGAGYASRSTGRKAAREGAGCG